MKIAILVLLFSSLGFARVHDYETTRLKSTGGAGVASVLLNESAILNPASLAFFNHGALYGQYDSPKIQGINANRNMSEEHFKDASKTTALIVADASKSVGGSASYQAQREGRDERRRVSTSFGGPIGKRSALGVSYRYTHDTEGFIGAPEREDKYHQMTIGSTHAVDEDLTLGVIFVDPLKAKSRDTRVIIGIQYLIKRMFSLILDGGSDYNEDLSDKAMYRGAIQMNIFRDFYLRAGLYQDKGINEKGNGFGLGWITPKLTFDLAFKNAKGMNHNSEFIQAGETQKETSFSIGYKF